ncbi:MAG: DeoR/GlpR family DNA-binding transcription regulator [Clostridia bacterium]|nr:DeoR/GlpR family DNA-binding transcription regulator [Clostridia bacterium]
MKKKRMEHIKSILLSEGEVQLQQLKKEFPDVSTMTLRRDLISLEKEGYLIRTYGGAILSKNVFINEEDNYSKRIYENIEQKNEIAQKAVGFIEEGRSLFLDAGTTLMYLAQKLPDKNLSIITSAANIGLEAIKKSNLTVMILGGMLNRNTLSLSGPNALSLLNNVNIDIAFMGTSGFSIDSGFTNANIYECQLKIEVIKRAKKVIMLMDTTKLNKNMPFTFANLEDIDILITDRSLPKDIKKEVENMDVAVY